MSQHRCSDHFLVPGGDKGDEEMGHEDGLSVGEAELSETRGLSQTQGQKRRKGRRKKRWGRKGEEEEGGGGEEEDWEEEGEGHSLCSSRCP